MKSKIDGTGAIKGSKKNISYRAVKGDLNVEKDEKTKCPYCHHDKKFIGNRGGQAIDKCTRCKRQYWNEK